MQIKTAILLALAIGLVAILPVHASVIQQYTAGINGANDYYWGQSFTTPSGGPWNHVTFNFFTEGTSDPLAEGTAYIFSFPYGGLGANGLPSASGILAISTGVSGGQYVFNSTFDLQSGTTYYLYEDTALDGVGICDGLGSCGASAQQGVEYYSEGPTVYYAVHDSNYITNYSVQGLVDTSVPEPATIGMSLLGVALLLIAKRRR